MPNISFSLITQQQQKQKNICVEKSKKKMAAISSKTDEDETYPNSSLTRPNKLESTGTGDFCCIPLCKSSTLDNSGNKTKIGMFGFPKDKKLERKWINIVTQFRRKGGKDSFCVKRTIKICEFHFEMKNIKISL